MLSHPHEPPNHHADYPGFSGAFGLLAGLSMLVGRAGVARCAADVACVRASDRVVDVGCGPGTAVREAARRGATVWGIDPAPVMLRLARILTPKNARIHWLEGAAQALPLEDGLATVLWSIATVHHWPDLIAGLAESRRVLKAGGRLVVIERSRQPGTTGLASHGWTDEQADRFVELAEHAGFEEARTETRAIGSTEHVIVSAMRG